MGLKFKKGDQVTVMTGRDRGRSGEILGIDPSKNTAVVRGINVRFRHQKPSQRGEGGIVTFEAPIHLSNLALMDPKDNKPTRVGMRILEDGRKVRFARKSGELIDD